jgi:magnesium chelatase family protein
MTFICPKVDTIKSRDHISPMQIQIKEIKLFNIFDPQARGSKIITLYHIFDPQPCGWFGVEDGVHHCICSIPEIERYNKKISGPIEDRIDIFIDVPKVDYDKYTSMKSSESSLKIRERVMEAVEIQMKRSGKLNGKMNASEVSKFCKLGEKEEDFFKNASKKLGLTARVMEKMLKVSRTIADLSKSDKIEISHIAEALQYRKRTFSI